MVTYAIGDIQGCERTFAALLDRLRVDPERDALWLTGDLVNRGPRSLAVLRRAVELSERMGARFVSVLGNHDLHLLARAAGLTRARRSDTLDDVLAAPDRDALLHWLRLCPLLHRALSERAPVDRTSQDRVLPDPSGSMVPAPSGTSGHVLVHAGLHPRWSIADAARLAAEVETAVRGERWRDALAAITTRSPEQWTETLAGDERLAAITAVLTRVRTCKTDGRLCRDFKGAPADAPRGCLPWYSVPGRASADHTLIVGHWATLGLHIEERVLALDTGCVWGGALTALRLEDRAVFQQPCADDIAH